MTSDRGGRFEIALPPGAYTVHPNATDLTQPPTAHPVELVVPPSGYAAVTIQFDSSIR